MAHALDCYVAEWERTRSRRSTGSEPTRLTRTREDAWHRFLSLGFPTTRDEEWRFTSVAPIAEGSFAPALPTSLNAAGLALEGSRLPAAAAQLVFVNGHYAPALCRHGVLPHGVRVERLTAALANFRHDGAAAVTTVAPFERHPFVAMNTALFADGAFVHVPAGAVVDAPIHLLFVTAGGNGGRPIMGHPRVLLDLAPNSQASIVETYVGLDRAQYFTNAVAEIVLGENAVLGHYRLQFESAAAYHVGAVHIQASRSATCASHSISMGGALVRNDVVAVLNGEGVECSLNGLYVADERRLIDNHTTIDHAQPHCGSREIYKGILAGHARGVFNGKIIVRPDAQKTDAKQTNRALLLSEEAWINTKPQLEILANDVKCTHGAAVGQLDDDAVFYLRSRGFSEASARGLLIHAFAADVLDRLPLASVRDQVEARVQRQLAQSLSAAA